MSTHREENYSLLCMDSNMGNFCKRKCSTVPENSALGSKSDTRRVNTGRWNAMLS